MAFYLDVSSLLETFATDLEVKAKISSKDEWVDGQAVQQYAEEWEKRNEPLIPNSLNTQKSDTLVRMVQGNYEAYNAIWFSSGEYNVESLVRHNGKVYKINEMKDLSDYSNVRIYYLIGQEDGYGSS